MAEVEKLLVCGHRGAPTEAPENTMSSFRRALAAGAGMIELDLRRTADGRGVVIHDRRVNRTTDGEGRVDSFTEDNIRELDAGSWFGGRYKGEKIPLLDEVLDWAAGAGAVLNIEIKDPEITEFAVKRVQAHNMLERSMLTSWNVPALARARELDPETRVAPIMITPYRLKAVAGSLRPNAVVLWSGPTLTSRTCALASSLSIPVIAWVVNTKALVDRVTSRGAKGVITDEAALIAKDCSEARRKDK